MSVRTIGTRFAIEGEREYKQALKDIRTELQNSKAQLELYKSSTKDAANSQAYLEKSVSYLSDRLKLQNASLDKTREALESAKRTQETYDTKVAEAAEALNKAKQELERMTDAGDASKESIDAQQQAVDQYERELADARAGQEAARAAVEDWTRKEMQAETQVNKTSAELNKNKKYLDEAKSSADHCATSIDEFGKRAKTAGDSASKLSGDVKSSKDSLDMMASVMVSSGINAKLNDIKQTMTECSEAAAEYESAIAKISTITDTSIVSMSQMSGELLKMSTEMGISTKDLSEAAYQAISASVDASKATEFTGKAARLAVGGFTDTTTAVDVLTTALNAYQLEEEETSRVSDILITTQRLGKTSVGELAASMGRAIPTAAAYGLQIDDLGTYYVTMTKNGIATAEATTYFNGMMTELNKSSSTVAKTLKNQTGKSFTELMTDGRSLGDIIDILSDSVDRDTVAFGNLWGNQSATKAALTLLNTGSQEYNQTLEEMQQSAGATDQAFETMADTAEMTDAKLQIAIENTKIAIGEQINPVLNSLKEEGAEILRDITEFVKEHPQVVQAIAALTTGLLAVVGGLTAVKAAMAAIDLLSGIGAVKGVTTALIAAAAALTTFGIGLVKNRTEQDEAFQATKQYRTAVKELNDAIKEGAEGYEENTQSLEDQVRASRKLVDMLRNHIKVYDGTVASAEAIKGIVDELNRQVPELALAYNAETNELNLTNSALDGMIERYAETTQYNADIERQNELIREHADLTELQSQAVERLEEAQKAFAEVQETANTQTLEGMAAVEEAKAMVGIYQQDVDDLTAALAANEAQTDAVRDAINNYTPVAEQSADRIVAFEQELQAAYEETYQAAYDSIEKQVGLFEKVDAKAEESIDDLIGNLQSQSEYMFEYAANLQKAMELGVDEGIVQELADGSVQSAKYLAAIVNGSKEDIDKLNTEFKKTEIGTEAMKKSIAGAEAEFTVRTAAMTSEYTEMVAGFDQYNAAMESAENTLRGLEAGIDRRRQYVIDKYRQLARDARKAYDAENLTASPAKKYKWSAEMTVEGVVKGVEENTPKAEASYREMARENIEAYQTAAKDALQKLNEAKNAETRMTAVPPVLDVETQARQPSWLGQVMQAFARSAGSQSQAGNVVLELTVENVMDGKVISRSTTRQVMKDIGRQQSARAAVRGGTTYVHTDI